MKYKILLAFAVIGLLSSAVLSFGNAGDFCLKDSKGKSGCDVVASSSYSKILGFNNAYVGVGVFFILLILLLYLQKRESEIALEITYLIIFSSSVVALYFIYLQAFVIRAFCTYCMIVDSAVLLSLLTIIYFELKK